MSKSLRLSRALVVGLTLAVLLYSAAAVFSTRAKEVKSPPAKEKAAAPVKESTAEVVYTHVYYFNSKTGETSWEHPKLDDGWFMALDKDTGRGYYYKEDGTTQWVAPDGVDWQAVGHVQQDL